MAKTTKARKTEAQSEPVSAPQSRQQESTTQPLPQSTPEATKPEGEDLWESLVSPAGYILAVSYPVLALSTGVRAIYQLFFRPDIVDYFPVQLSALAALFYLVATIGFAYRRQWSWYLSVGVLGLETIMTLTIGVWSLIDPEAVGRTVWRRFGEDYGYFPLFQPLIGIVWLVWPQTIRAYGVRMPPRRRRPDVSQADMSQADRG